MITVEVLNLENLIPLELVSALSEDSVLEVMRGVVAGARDHWIKLASKQFHTTKAEYIGGIQEIEWRGKDTAVISLVGVLPNLLEQGMRTVDMHDTLLGPNVPVSPVGQKGKHPRVEGGYFRAIPFRHYTPGAGAHGVQMGKALEKLLGPEYAKTIGNIIYGAAKKLTATTQDPYGKTEWGGRLDTGDLYSWKGSKLPKPTIPKLKPYHHSDPYAGMVRIQQTYEKATQSQYKTFRTISVDGSGAPLGSSPWIRPGTAGAELAKQVSEYVGTRLAPMAFQAYVNSLR